VRGRYGIAREDEQFGMAWQCRSDVYMNSDYYMTDTLSCLHGNARRAMYAKIQRDVLELCIQQ